MTERNRRLKRMQGNDKKTVELENALQAEINAQGSLEKFLKEQGIFEDEYYAYMSDLLYEKGYNKEQIYKKANISRSYGRKILGGETGVGLAKRDYIIRIAYVADFKLIEVNRALKLAGLSELYVKVPRDAALIVAFNKGIANRNLDDLNEYLKGYGFESLDKN